MEYKNSRLMLSYAEAKKIHKSSHPLTVGLKPYGLQSILENHCWIDSGKEVSYLEVVDKKKYLLAKLKYGI